MGRGGSAPWVAALCCVCWLAAGGRAAGFREGGRWREGVAQWLEPDEPVPKFQVSTRGGPVEFPIRGVPNLFYVANKQNAFTQATLGAQGSAEGLLTLPSNGTHFTFLTNDTTPAKFAMEVEGLFEAAFTQLNFTRSQIKAWRARLHFATDRVSDLPDWVGDFLLSYDWNINRTTAQGHLSQGGFTMIAPRLDCAFGFAYPYGTHNNSWPMVYVPASTPAGSLNLTGKVALLSRKDFKSDYAKAGALILGMKGAGMVMWNDIPGAPLEAMSCNGCNGYPIGAAMIGSPLGKALYDGLSANQTVNFSAGSANASAYGFAINPSGLLEEAGLFWSPRLKFLAWEAQWLAWKSKEMKVAEGATPYNLFKNTLLGPPNQGRVVVPFTDTATIKHLFDTHEKVWLAMKLDCPGPSDKYCPKWDRVMRLDVNCTKAVLWPPNAPEVGRWITPFRRRVGYWLTDVTDLRSVLTTDKSCSLFLSTAPWVGTPGWVVSLDLLFDGPRPTEVALESTKLWMGSYFRFNTTYNEMFPVRNVSFPNGTTRVEIRSVITGHGSDHINCAEFCSTLHYITATPLFPGGHRVKNLQNFSMPITDPEDGCTDTVIDGSIPNEHGTWLYGRDGWCDGTAVKPHTFDVDSACIDPNRKIGEPAGKCSLQYQGFLWNGKPDKPIPPIKQWAYIEVAIYAVAWGWNPSPP